MRHRPKVVNTVDTDGTPPYGAAVAARDIDASPTSWREDGSPDAPVAVLLHGLGGSRTAWRPQLEGLADVRRCVAWDAPGAGASERVAERSFDAYADRALALLDTVSPGEPVDLVGMSFGGMVAQYATARRPDRVRSLVLLCTSPKFGLDGTDPVAWQEHRLAGLEAFGSTAAAAPPILSSLAGPRAQHVVPEAVESMSRVTLDGLLDNIATITGHDSRAILPTIPVPTLVLVGEDDDETPVAYGQAIVDLMPHARLEVIPGAGHLLNLEAPDAVNAAIRRHWEANAR